MSLKPQIIYSKSHRAWLIGVVDHHCLVSWLVGDETNWRWTAFGAVGQFAATFPTSDQAEATLLSLVLTGVVRKTDSKGYPV